MGWYLDGRVSAVVGTHRHVQTADERVLPKGTAYITDLGHDRPDGLGHRRGPGAGHRPLPHADAEPVRARQGAGHAPRRGDPHRSRHRSRRSPSSACASRSRLIAVVRDPRRQGGRGEGPGRGEGRRRGSPGQDRARPPRSRSSWSARIPPPQLYVRSKKRDGRRGGHRLARLPLPAGLLAGRAARDHRGDQRATRPSTAILLQLPLPKGLDEDAAIAAIAPEKDADGLHPMNLGNLLGGKPTAGPVHAGRLPRDPRPLRHPARGRGGGGGRPLAPGGQAARAAPARAPRHRHHVPHAHAGPRRALPARRHPLRGRRPRPAWSPATWCKRGRGRHRRGHQPAATPASSRATWTSPP